MVRLARLYCPLLLMLACFAPVLFADQQFAFRDSGDFYYPLYLRVQQEWRAGRLPLWEPEENGGVPLLGNPAAAVLYPGKLIYAVFSYPWAARIYIIAHVALAYAATWIMMRGWKISPAGAMLGRPRLCVWRAGIAPVLQRDFSGRCRMDAAGVLLRRSLAAAGPSSRLVWMAAVLSMQILGGDPQAAYLAALGAGALCRLALGDER